MFRPVALYLGWRMLRTPQPDRFVSLVAILGFSSLAVGVAVMIITLSVMNGFENTIKQQLLATLPQVTVAFNSSDVDPAAITAKLDRHPEIIDIVPFSGGKILLIGKYAALPAELRGIAGAKNGDSQEEGAAGSFEQLTENSWNIILSETLALSLGVSVHDTVQAMIPQTSSFPFGLIPRNRQLTVAGIVPTRGQADNSLARVHIGAANRLFRYSGKAMGLELMLKDPLQASAVAAQLTESLGNCCTADSWQQRNTTLFAALRMEKTLMAVLLLFIVLVASFNLVCMLNVTVATRRIDAVMLLALGADHSMLVRAFACQGLLLGGFGILLGTMAGIALSLGLESAVHFLQNLTGYFIFDPAVYFISGLTADIQPIDVLLTALGAALLILPACWLPCLALRRIKPSAILHNA